MKYVYILQSVTDRFYTGITGDLGGSDPVSTFGRQNRTNTRVAPAQIEVSPAVFLQPHSGLVDCTEGLYLEERQNAKGMFRPEHCVYFSVLPR